MPEPQDIELGGYKETYDGGDTEREALLPDPEEQPQLSNLNVKQPTVFYSPRFGFRHLIFAFFGGGLACLLAQYAICGPKCFTSRSDSGHVTNASNLHHDLAPPYVGSTERHHFPPTSPTNAFPSLFPTDIGFAGPTPTGAEPALIATAPTYPLHTGAPQLVKPPSLAKSGPKKAGYDLFKLWGNLSPWYSVGKGTFGLDSGPEAPDSCRITGLHLLHRHGARYPTAYCQYDILIHLTIQMKTRFWI